jgi:hypothetical protein
MSGSFDEAGPLQRVLHMFAERHASDDKGLELADEMRRSLLKVTFADSVKAYSSKRNEPHMLDVCIPVISLNQTQLENCTILTKVGATLAIFVARAKCSIGDVLPGLVL